MCVCVCVCVYVFYICVSWEDPLEKEKATHSSTLAWKIPRMEEPGRLQSVGSQWVGHNWATSLSHKCTYIYICMCMCVCGKQIHLPLQETWVWSHGWEDPLEKEMVTRSSVPAWEIPWTEKPGGLWSMWLQRVRHNLVTKQPPQQCICIYMYTHTYIYSQALATNKT